MQQLITRTGTSDSKTGAKLWSKLGPTLYKDSRPIFNSNQAIPFGAKVEISPKGFTLGASVSFTGEFFKKFDLKNMILTYTKDFL